MVAVGFPSPEGRGDQRGEDPRHISRGGDMVIARMRWRLLATIAVLGVAAGACGYNTIQTYDEQVNAAASQIKVQLQRRAGLVPNHLQAPERDAKHGEKGFLSVAASRAHLSSGGQAGGLLHSG